MIGYLKYAILFVAGAVVGGTIYYAQKLGGSILPTSPPVDKTRNSEDDWMYKMNLGD